MDGTAMPARPRVAIVGAGPCGTAAATRLSSTGMIEVHLFDMGARGPGGRCSHRSVRLSDGATLQPEAAAVARAAGEAILEFDHGCQFFRADTQRFQKIVAEWESLALAAHWNGRFGRLDSSTLAQDSGFFGLLSGAPLFVGCGGMHNLCRGLAKQAEVDGAHLHMQVRVSELRPSGDGPKRYTLFGYSGIDAFHDTPEAAFRAVGPPKALAEGATFDAVLLTDVSTLAGSWHRADAGVAAAAPSLSARAEDVVRVPLLAAMLAFEPRLPVDLDAIAFGTAEGGSVHNDSPLWVAVRSSSKPEQHSCAADCWTVLATPAFSNEQLVLAPMRDSAAAGGGFKPQEASYTESFAADLGNAFLDAVCSEASQDAPRPQLVYAQGQRWGSAFAAKYGASETAAPGGRFADVAATSEAAAAEPSGSRTFFCDSHIFWAGDFAASLAADAPVAPSVEMAVISGQDAVAQIEEFLGCTGQ
eukprot:TRINITY_DN16091_c0_g1_i1.p1 TRINITY_DN16091_c0_g1~~TRINITY_DN16091_c0_g1_i1.p1  ORF type:complete len:473 (-),score=80.98 TRINITY_DN16091_c0_g1_i1:179-1597(-)